jgi:hypothetical protein
MAEKAASIAIISWVMFMQHCVRFWFGTKEERRYWRFNDGIDNIDGL